MKSINFQDIPRATIVRAFFATGLTIEDVQQSINGELPDVTYTDSRCGLELTFTYGNGELIVSTDSDNDNSRIFYVTSNGFNSLLVED